MIGALCLLLLGSGEIPDIPRSVRILSRGFEQISIAGKRRSETMSVMDISKYGGSRKKFAVDRLDFQQDRMIAATVLADENWVKDPWKEDYYPAERTSHSEVKCHAEVPWSLVSSVEIVAPAGTVDRYRRDGSLTVRRPGETFDRVLRVVFRFSKPVPAKRTTSVNGVSKDAGKKPRPVYDEHESFESLIGELSKDGKGDSNAAIEEFVFFIETHLLVMFSAEGFAEDIKRDIASVSKKDIATKVTHW